MEISRHTVNPCRQAEGEVVAEDYRRPDSYLDLQAPPREELFRALRCRRALDASAEHLMHTARHLARRNPAYREALRHSLRSIRQAYTALLEWNGFSPAADAPLAELAAPAERLVSMLRTCWDRAFPIASLEAGTGGENVLPVVLREQAETSYYTARNTLAVVLGSLPERVTREAIRALNRAEAIRSGRIEPEPDEYEPVRASAAGRPARLRPVSTV